MSESKPHCGWCGQDENTSIAAGSYQPVYSVRIDGVGPTQTWYPSWGGEPITLTPPALMAFICRKCFKDVFEACSYLDVSAV